ncbi:ribosome hibernation-promoting factor, HPF/YfiA family [Chthonobacter rhizosphaerae]|uniref:ribosome hibernation-promoting factor, HPF/YfiA family n=1 Tax=Chthonobacter rhizosphaerae TaxID=2735553 RepID=UPI0015EEF053|nr:ribosome-associated translation inhibitor RaiA [Chthonobacter rhizosphaerae]
MPLRISGKNVDIGQALRVHIEGRISEALDKYFDGGYTGHVVVEREGSGYSTDCSIHLDTGTVLQSRATAHEIYAAADQAAERIGKRLRRYKRKLKGRHPAENGRDEDRSFEAPSYVLAAPDEDEEVAEDFAPVVVAETTQRIATTTVGRAVMDLDLTGVPVVVFRNAGSGAINVVYRRGDGNIGWIDPALSDMSS